MGGEGCWQGGAGRVFFREEVEGGSSALATAQQRGLLVRCRAGGGGRFRRIHHCKV